MGEVTPLTMIFGCGNVIMGDDGFGPAVIAALNSRYTLPDTAKAVDAGTAVRDYLFDYLLLEEGRPDEVIIVDAVDFPGKQPGEVFSIRPADIPSAKICDFSLHQFPTVNLLQELEQHTGIRVVVYAVQVEHIPEEIAPGLTPTVEAAVPLVCEAILRSL